ncbi:MAG: ABC transporter substrate-binding protein [Bacteroidota bacterium]|nr:ABC transporter substrate-binding protein [Bacteroidota bacterium]
MKYFTKIKKTDSILIVIFWIGLSLLFVLSFIGKFYDKNSFSNDTNCGINNLESRIATVLSDHQYFIAVVGDGVPSEAIVKDRPYNTQYAQGYDLYQGIQHAIKLPEFDAIKKQVGILYIDDGGNPSCAKKISKILASHPELLGVIGHSTTSSTKEAIPNYEASNIPFIIPAATNPTLLATHPKNCFRLPSNDKIQSLVISDLILKKLSCRYVFIIWDATPEALQYSEYLKTNIQNYVNFNQDSLSMIIEGSYPISLNPLNYTYLFRRIVSSNTDVIVFCGYGSLAREFLLGLDDEYSHYKNKIRPKVIL